MARAYNFNAGPATLPESVLQQVKEELLEYKGAQASIIEVSHRGSIFKKLAEEIINDLRELLIIPNNYSIIFLHGGATIHFSLVPLNFAKPNQPAGYLLTGQWGKKSMKEASSYCQPYLVASSEKDKFTNIPTLTSWNIKENSAYIHYTPNETITGVEFYHEPNVKPIPLVADMTSYILSKPINIRAFDVIYAGAQKNIGPAGISVAIINNELLKQANKTNSGFLSYQVHANENSMFNTPPTFSWYVSGLVLQWVKQQGGVTKMAELNQQKSQFLYEYIDESGFYTNPVNKECRSSLNVPFTLADPSLDALFLMQAEQQGLIGLKGHRFAGGMRASMYNAMPFAGVKKLVEFMQEFERKHG